MESRILKRFDHDGVKKHIHMASKVRRTYTVNWIQCQAQTMEVHFTSTGTYVLGGN